MALLTPPWLPVENNTNADPAAAVLPVPFTFVYGDGAQSPYIDPSELIFEHVILTVGEVDFSIIGGSVGLQQGFEARCSFFDAHGVFLLDMLDPLALLCFFVPISCITVPAVIPVDLLPIAVNYVCANAHIRIVPGDECIPIGILEIEITPWIIGDDQLIGSGILIGG